MFGLIIFGISVLLKIVKTRFFCELELTTVSTSLALRLRCSAIKETVYEQEGSER